MGGSAIARGADGGAGVCLLPTDVSVERDVSEGWHRHMR